MYHGALRALEFDRIVATVCRFAQTPPGRAMLAAGFTEDDVDRVLWRNPLAFFGQSGRLLLDLSTEEPGGPAGSGGPGDPETFEGNSILRGTR